MGGKWLLYWYLGRLSGRPGEASPYIALFAIGLWVCVILGLLLCLWEARR